MEWDLYLKTVDGTGMERRTLEFSVLVRENSLCNTTSSVLFSCSCHGFAHYACFISIALPSEDNCTNGGIRLVGGSTEFEGRVEVCYDNQWGTVCSNSWSSYDAMVSCHQLGFSPRGNNRTDIARASQQVCV